LSADGLTPAQRELLWALLEEHAATLSPELAERELERIRAAGLESLRFLWIGSPDAGAPHYYRLHGPHFAIEYDNIQNGANHSHVVWRDFERDFGGDLLKRHHAEGHGGVR